MTIRRVALFNLPWYLFLVLIIFWLIWFVHYWIGDDILITFRSVIHFVNGDGIVWNPNERVQAFTHPLWFFCISFVYWITGDLFYSTLFLSFIFSSLAYIGLLSYTKNNLSIFLSVVLVYFSFAFIDYTSSGLENPLSYALLFLVCDRFLKRKIDTRLFVFMGLVFLTRMDFALLLLPMALFAWREIQFKIKPILWGILLPMCWMLFSIFYFGHPFSNTFLAKLSSAFPISEYYERFTYYVRFSFEYDPMTLFIILLGVIIPIIKRGRALWISLGIILYIYYIAHIGGDFMAGRFFAVPVYLSILVLILTLRNVHFLRKSPIRCHRIIKKLQFSHQYFTIGLFVVSIPVFLFGKVLLSTPITDIPFLIEQKWNNVETDEKQGWLPNTKTYMWNWDSPMSGVIDEKGRYYLRGFPTPNSNPKTGWLMHPRPGTLTGHTGLTSLHAYVWDHQALASPYAARLPIYNSNHHDWIIDFDWVVDQKYIEQVNNKWQIGHIIRPYPLSFSKWIGQDIENMPDKKIDILFKDIRLVSSGKLFSIERIKAIIRLNFKNYELSNVK